jgi:hypothetical protein
MMGGCFMSRKSSGQQLVNKWKYDRFITGEMKGEWTDGAMER